MDELIKRIAKEFLIEGEVIEVDSHVNGLVNKTFLIYTLNNNKKHRYVIQKINQYVFKKPKKLMENIVKVTNHIKKKQIGETLTVVWTKEGKSFYEENNQYFRCYRYLKNSVNFNILKNIQQFLEVGRAVGKFQEQLADFPANELYPIIPDFHHTPKRYLKLLEVIKSASQERINNTNLERQFIKEKQKDLKLIQSALEQKIIPIRVTHNDTKLNNVMFDELTNRALCLIDLDTVMPGTVLYDYGDALRVGASTTAEDDPNIDHVDFDLKKFIAFSLGFLEQSIYRLSLTEFELLADSVFIITMECGIRFLTDYLANDVYFLTYYPEHNLIRAKNQFQLAKKIKILLPKMRKILMILKNKLLIPLD